MRSYSTCTRVFIVLPRSLSLQAHASKALLGDGSLHRNSGALNTVEEEDEFLK